jgi:hypothetical protein
VVELQWLLAQVLEDKDIHSKLVASVSAIEGCTYEIQNALLQYSSGRTGQDIYFWNRQQPRTVVCAYSRISFLHAISVSPSRTMCC